jgi:hypothetical protein
MATEVSITLSVLKLSSRDLSPILELLSFPAMSSTREFWASVVLMVEMSVAVDRSVHDFECKKVIILLIH